VLQWPLFGLFPAFMFWRMHRLRQRETRVRAEPAKPKPVPPAMPVPDGPEDELTAYNRYLAELNAKDQSR
jgi:hypothetical protein